MDYFLADPGLKVVGRKQKSDKNELITNKKTASLISQQGYQFKGRFVVFN
ncbi:MAG: hypothetical protein RBS07_17100 [Lentimicrobium sp.]|jgi:hypothetical protein|nr:hypothetical protein [Lentimicrobium sp.]